MLKSTPLGRNEGAKRDIECHGRQGQLFESHLTVKLTDLCPSRGSRRWKMYGTFHNPPDHPGELGSLLCKRLCDVHGKEPVLLQGT